MSRRSSVSRTAIFLLAALAVSEPASGLVCHPEYDGSERGEGVRHCYFRVFVWEAETDANGNVTRALGPLPCVELRTNNKAPAAYRTDANGIAAFFEPGWMGRGIRFHPIRTGYKNVAQREIRVEEGGINVNFRIFMKRDPNTAPNTCTPETPTIDPVTDYVPSPSEHFAIRIVDETGRGVPMVAVRSPNRTYFTDGNGLVALHDPDLMGTNVRFEISGEDHRDGYRFVGPNSDRIIFLDVVPNGLDGLVELTVEHVEIAERVYRVTGAGIYRDSWFLGVPMCDEVADPNAELCIPIREPLLNAGVVGQDSVHSTVYQGKAFWVWGDTAALGHTQNWNYKGTAATSVLPGPSLFPPSERGIDLEYFKDGDSTKKMAQGTPGGTTWLNGLFTVPDGIGGEALFAAYSWNKKNTPTELGLMRFDDVDQVFVKQFAFPAGMPARPGDGDRVRHGDEEYVYFGGGLRIPASIDAVLDEDALIDAERQSPYEVFTAFKQGTEELDRDVFGVLHYSWKPDTKGVSGEVVPPEERLRGHQRDPDTSEPANTVFGRTHNWNEYRQRYVQVSANPIVDWDASTVTFRPAYGESDTPMGPFVYARKVLRIDPDEDALRNGEANGDNWFYWPHHHAFLDQENGRKIFFDATYTAFSIGIEGKGTPYYNYNQVMYKLDLADERLFLPVAVYDLSADVVPGDFVTKRGIRPDMEDPPVAFFAPDRPKENTVPVYWSGAACAQPRLVVGGTPAGEPLFYALRADTVDPPPDAVPLHEYASSETGDWAYGVDPQLDLEGFVREPNPIAWVWHNPISVILPVTDYLPPLIADAGQDICVFHPASKTDRDGDSHHGEMSDRVDDFGVRSPPQCDSASPGPPGLARARTAPWAALKRRTVRLDASGSSFSEGSITSYEWAWDDGQGSVGTATGVNPEIALPFDSNVITLTVTGDDGRTSTDEVVVDFLFEGRHRNRRGPWFCHTHGSIPGHHGPRHGHPERCPQHDAQSLPRRRAP